MSPQTVWPVAQAVPLFVLMSVPVVQPVEPVVTGEPAVFQHSIIPLVLEMVTVCAELKVPPFGLMVGEIAGGVPEPRVIFPVPVAANTATPAVSETTVPGVPAPITG